MKIKHLLFFLIPALLIIACEKVPGTDNEPSGNETVIDLQGSAQKGQLVKGSQVTAFALNDQLVSLGSSYPAAISDDLGSFKVSAVTEANYLELRAEGYYFIENTGSLASSPIYLQAIVESKDKNANLNLLTTLTAPRIKYLVASGSGFTKAKSQAQDEILKVLGKGAYTTTTTDFDEMDISKDSDANAILLALSCLLQEGRSTVEVVELISEISAVFEKTGTVSDALVNKLYANKDRIDILAIINNMKTFYANKGMSDYSIPSFYKYTNDAYANSFVVLNANDFYIDEEHNILTKYRLSKTGASFDLFFLSPVNVSFRQVDEQGKEASYEWVQVSVEAYGGSANVAHFSIESNQGAERYAYVNILNAEGSILQRLRISQESGLQVIYIPNRVSSPGGSGTKSSISDQLSDNPVPAGTDVLINGKVYTIPESRQLTVPCADNYFIGYPADRVSRTDWYFDVDYPTKVYDSFFAYYCYLENVYQDSVEATLWYITGIFCLYSEMDFYMIRVTANDGAQLAGLRRYDPVETYASQDPGYNPSDYINTVELYDIEDDNEVAFSLPPQTLTYLKLEIYDQNNQLLATKELSREIPFKQGQLMKVKFSF